LQPIPAPSHHDVAAADSELLQHRPFFSSGPFRHRQRRSLKEREKSATEQCRTASRTHSPSTAASGGGQRLNRERHQPLQRQQTLEVNHEDDDAVSVGTTDSDVASVAAEVEATSSNVSRRGSVASDESTAVEGETVTDDVAEVNSSLSSTSFAAVTEYIVRLKKLFNKSAKVGIVFILIHSFECTSSFRHVTTIYAYLYLYSSFPAVEIILSQSPSLPL
jgi:hypothetical protein